MNIAIVNKKTKIKSTNSFLSRDDEFKPFIEPRNDNVEPVITLIKEISGEYEYYYKVENDGICIELTESEFCSFLDTSYQEEYELVENDNSYQEIYTLSNVQTNTLKNQSNEVSLIENSIEEDNIDDVTNENNLFNKSYISIKVTDEFIDHLKLMENDVNIVYDDAEPISKAKEKTELKGNLTAGIGHKLNADELKIYKKGDSITDEQKFEWLENDTSSAYHYAKIQAVKCDIYDQKFIDALTAVNFQMGTSWDKKFPKAFKALKEHDWDKAIYEIEHGSSGNESIWKQKTSKRVEDFKQAILEIKSNYENTISYSLISNPVGEANSNNQEGETVVKERLIELGIISKTNKDEPLSKHIKKYQKIVGLKQSGIIRPNDETEKYLRWSITAKVNQSQSSSNDSRNQPNLNSISNVNILKPQYIASGFHEIMALMFYGLGSNTLYTINSKKQIVLKKKEIDTELKSLGYDLENGIKFNPFIPYIKQLIEKPNESTILFLDWLHHNYLAKIEYDNKPIDTDEGVKNLMAFYERQGEEFTDNFIEEINKIPKKDWDLVLEKFLNKLGKSSDSFIVKYIEKNGVLNLSETEIKVYPKHLDQVHWDEKSYSYAIQKLPSGDLNDIAHALFISMDGGGTYKVLLEQCLKVAVAKGYTKDQLIAEFKAIMEDKNKHVFFKYNTDLENWINKDRETETWNEYYGDATYKDTNSSTSQINLGDPLISMEILPTAAGIKGGFYGYTRLDKDLNPKFHDGIDLKANVGDSVYSINSGTVGKVVSSQIQGLKNCKENEGDKDSAGNRIYITGDTEEKIQLGYWHLSEIAINKNTGKIYKSGDKVEKGDLIGFTGSTGNASHPGSGGPHLHLNCKINGNKADPQKYIKTKFNDAGKSINNASSLPIKSNSESIWKQNNSDAKKTADYFSSSLKVNEEQINSMLKYLDWLKDDFAYYLVENKSKKDLLVLKKETLSDLKKAMEAGVTGKEEKKQINKISDVLLIQEDKLFLEESLKNLKKEKILTAGVGKGQKNNPADVEMVVLLFSEIAIFSFLECYIALSDEVKLIELIERYQKRINYGKSDGIISPSGKTINLLVKKVKGIYLEYQ